jgi:hypothetical protein
MDQIFYNETRSLLRETFTKMPSTGNPSGTGYGYIGQDLNYKTIGKINNLNGNMVYQNSVKAGFLGVESPFKKNSDDNPLYYGFPKSSLSLF